MVTVVILSFNTKKLLEDCLKSIFSRKWQHEMEVWVVDNASSDGSLEMVKSRFQQVKVIENTHNLGFATANNQVIKRVNSDVYILLNSDTEVLDGSLDKLADFLKSSEYGIGSCKVLNKDGSFQPNAGELPFGLPLFFWIAGWDDILPVLKKSLPSFHRKFAGYYDREKEVGWVSGSVMAIKRQVVEKIGGLDENIFMYGEDVDYCIRAKKAGFKIGWTDKAEIIHLGGGSSKDPSVKQWVGEFKGLTYIYKKHLGYFAGVFLKLLIIFFTVFRSVAFLAVGKPKVAGTYAKTIFSI